MVNGISLFMIMKLVKDQYVQDVIILQMANKKDADLERGLQNAETVQDSLSQRLNRLCGRNAQISKDAVYVLIQIRTMQSNYYPVKQHSLLRYNGKYFDSVTGEKRAKELEPTKHNWRKYKRDKEREKLPKLMTFVTDGISKEKV